MYVAKRNRGTPAVLEDTCTGLAHSFMLALSISSFNVERAFSTFRVINRKKRAAVMDPNIGYAWTLDKYACIDYKS